MDSEGTDQAGRQFVSSRDDHRSPWQLASSLEDISNSVRVLSCIELAHDFSTRVAAELGPINADLNTLDVATFIVAIVADVLAKDDREHDAIIDVCHRAAAVLPQVHQYFEKLREAEKLQTQAHQIAADTVVPPPPVIVP